MADASDDSSYSSGSPPQPSYDVIKNLFQFFSSISLHLSFGGLKDEDDDGW